MYVLLKLLLSLNYKNNILFASIIENQLYQKNTVQRVINILKFEMLVYFVVVTRRCEVMYATVLSIFLINIVKKL